MGILKSTRLNMKWTVPSLMLLTWFTFHVTSFIDAEKDENNFINELNAFSKATYLGDLPSRSPSLAAGIVGLYMGVYGIALALLCAPCQPRIFAIRNSICGSSSLGTNDGQFHSSIDDDEDYSPAPVQPKKEYLFPVKESSLEDHKTSCKEASIEALKIIVRGGLFFMCVAWAVFYGMQVHDEFHNEAVLRNSLDCFPWAKNENLNAAVDSVAAVLAFGLSTVFSLGYLILKLTGLLESCKKHATSQLFNNNIHSNDDISGKYASLESSGNSKQLAGML